MYYSIKSAQKWESCQSYILLAQQNSWNSPLTHDRPCLSDQADL